MSGITILSLVLSSVAVLAGAAALFINWRDHKFLQKLFLEAGHEEFGEVLLSHQRQLKRNQEGLKALAQRVDSIEIKSNFLLKRVGLVKYNPFEQSGGNMSFSLSFLDNNGDGVVLTSLHSREGIRLYSKAVKEYESENVLTEEEKEAIQRARN